MVRISDEQKLKLLLKFNEYDAHKWPQDLRNKKLRELLKDTPEFSNLNRGHLKYIYYNILLYK